MQGWLASLQGADGEEVDVNPGVSEELLASFDSQATESPSLYLYSTDTRIAPVRVQAHFCQTLATPFAVVSFRVAQLSNLAQRTSATVGLDYSKYYRALNNTLNHDMEGPALRSVVPLVQHMARDLCCFADGAPRKFDSDMSKPDRQGCFSAIDQANLRSVICAF